MQHLQRALLVADGRELVRALERILGFLCEERVRCLCVCCYVAGAPSARWRDAGLSPLARRRRESSPGAAPQPCAPPPLCWRASTCCLSYSPPARVLGPDAAAHVKILVSHDASEAAAGASLLTQQVAQLMQTTQELQAEIRRNKSTPTLGSRKPPLAAGRDALGPGAPSPSSAATARGPSLGSTSPKGPLKPRTPGGAQTARGGSSTPRLSLGTPRAGSPAPRRPGSATFHASMRGGPLQA